MIGQPVRRREDLRLLTGRGRYSDDINAPGQTYAVIVRSPHAHALIRGIDTAAARAAAGVLTVLTGRDMLADGLKPIPHAVRMVIRWTSDWRTPTDRRFTFHRIIRWPLMRCGMSATSLQW